MALDWTAIAPLQDRDDPQNPDFPRNPPLDPMQGQQLDLGPVRLQVSYSSGKTPAVVFIHGGLGNRFHWRSQWEFLQQQQVQVLAYDLAGHGHSQRHDRYSLSQHTQDLKHLLDHFQIQSPILCCHSYGVPLGLEWARHHDVSALIAIGGGTHNLTPWWEIPIVQFLASGGYHLLRWPRLQAWVHQLTSAHPTESVRQFHRESPLPTEAHPYQSLTAFWGYDGRPHPICCPSLVITGAEDPVFPPAMGEELAQQIRRQGAAVRHVVVPSVGHLVMVEAATVVNQLLGEMVAHVVQTAENSVIGES